MCFGGGGGDDGSKEIRRDEARRELDMAKASREINKLFGIYNPDNVVDGQWVGPVSGPLSGYTDWFSEQGFDGSPYTTKKRRVPNEDSIDNSPLFRSSRTVTLQVPPYGKEYGDYAKSLGYILSKKYNPTQRTGIAGSGGNTLGYISPEIEGPYGAKRFGSGYSLPSDAEAGRQAYENYLAREAAYDKNRSDIMRYFTHGLDEQLMDTTERQTYDLARRGLLQGSEDLQAEAGRTRRYDDALFKLTNEADSSVNNLRSSDEQARLNLLGNIRAGMDRESAVAGATAALRNNLNTAANAAYATQFTGLFDDLNDIYKNYNYNTGQSRGMVMPYGGGYSPGSKV